MRQKVRLSNRFRSCDLGDLGREFGRNLERDLGRDSLLVEILQHEGGGSTSCLIKLRLLFESLN